MDGSESVGNLIKTIKQGSGESVSPTEPSEVSEHCWADDEEDPEEFAAKSTNLNDICMNCSRKTCLLCQENLVGSYLDKPHVCTRCIKRLREWMPGGIEELSVRGSLATMQCADRSPEDINDEDSLYFCPVGAEHRILFGRFSNLPRFADCRPVSSSGSEIDLETVLVIKKESIRRKKEKARKHIWKVNNQFCRMSKIGYGRLKDKVVGCKGHCSNQRPNYKSKKNPYHIVHGKK